MEIHRLAALLATTTALIAGCGGDDERLSKQDFSSKAEAICADANRKEAALHPGGLGWHSGPKFGDPEFLSRFNAAGRAALRRLRALAPPEEDAKRVDALVSSIDGMVGAVDEQIAALRSGHRDRTQANVRRYELAYSDLATSAGSLGLTECQGLST
jgi:hypothetical protein